MSKPRMITVFEKERDNIAEVSKIPISEMVWRYRFIRRNQFSEAIYSSAIESLVKGLAKLTDEEIMDILTNAAEAMAKHEDNKIMEYLSNCIEDHSPFEPVLMPPRIHVAMKKLAEPTFVQRYTVALDPADPKKRIVHITDLSDL